MKGLSYSQRYGQGFGSEASYAVVVQVEVGFTQLTEVGGHRGAARPPTGLQVPLCGGRAVFLTGAIWKEGGIYRNGGNGVGGARRPFVNLLSVSSPLSTS